MSLCRCLMLLTLTLTTAFGCATSEKPVERKLADEFSTGLTLEPGYAQKFDFATRWVRSITVESDQQIVGSRVLGNLLVIVETPRNIVSAIKVDTGELAWKVVLGEPLETLYAAIGNDDYIFVNSNRRLFTIDRVRGELVKIDNLGYTVNMSPLLYKNLAIFGSVNGRVFAFDVRDGFKKWSYLLSDKITATPVRDESQVFIADTSGSYVMVAGDSGEMRWRGSTYGPITAAPVRDRAFMIIASEDQSLYSLISTTGRHRWPAFRSEAPLTATPVVIDRVIYLLEPDVGLTAINANTGKTIWSSDDVRVPLTTLGDVLLAHDDTSLAKIDPENGQSIESAPTKPLQTVLIGPDDSLILIAQDGQIQRVDAR